MAKWLSPKKHPIPFHTPFIGFFRIKKEYYVWPLIRYPHDEIYSILKAEYNASYEIDYPDAEEDYLDLENDANHRLLKWMPLPKSPKLRDKK